MVFTEKVILFFKELTMSKEEKIKRENQIKKLQQEKFQMKYREYSSLILKTFKSNNKNYYYIDKVNPDKAIAYRLFYYPNVDLLYVAMHHGDGNKRDIVKKVYLCQEGKLCPVAELEIFSLLLLCDSDLLSDDHLKEDAFKECNYFDIKEFKWSIPNAKPDFTDKCLIYNIYFSSLI